MQIHKENLLCFPVSYGDAPKNDGHRLSDKFLLVVSSKKFKDISLGLFTIVFFTLGQPAASSAIPAEAGEHVVAAADAAVNGGQAAALIPEGVNAAPVVGKAGAAAAAEHVALKPLVPGGQVGNGFGLPGGPPAPGQPPIYMPLSRPMTPIGRTLNTITFGGSIAVICLNAYWGSPVAIAGCTFMVITWFGNVLGIRLGG